MLVRIASGPIDIGEPSAARLGAPAPELPRVSPEARVVGSGQAARRPHVVVDGAHLDGTALALSHWPDSGTPGHLAADTSTGIVERYLGADPSGQELGLVTNNHYDEDGALGIWLLLEGRGASAERRRLAVAAAEAGDFHVWSDPAAARCALALMAMGEPATTPFSSVRRALARPAGPEPAAEIYRAVVPRIAGLLDDPDRYRLLWRDRWSAVESDLALLDSGAATVEELPELDLAVVRAPRPLLELAVYPRTARSRVLMASNDGLRTLRYRYETWVRFVSRPLRARVDLAPALFRLDARETASGSWRFEGVSPATPRLYFADGRGRPAPSGLTAEGVVELLAPWLGER
jgi:hypothetical protein